MHDPKKAKPICFYLPQFHRVAENDQWWGDGFTEWTLLKNARPLYVGHQQPETPDGALAYYDASEISTRRQQAALAREYGIYGFCYYHYWFNGKRLLEKPLEKMLEDGEPDLPFCLCWANEPWSRRWSGEEQQVLQPQVYGGREDWEAHFNELYRFFTHKNYICVDDQPVFLIYRIGHIPEAREMIACWRELAAEKGLAGLHIVAVEGSFKDNQSAPDFVDAMAEHQPSCVLDQCSPLLMNGLSVFSVEDVWQQSLQKKPSLAVHYPGVCHAWDNTPRRGRNGQVILASRPSRYQQHLERVFERVSDREQAPFVFVNAWNEWSEGAHLEPETQNGLNWLNCFKQALQGSEQNKEADLLEDVYAGSCPQRLIERPRMEPDPDLINIVIQHQIKVACVLEFGCAGALSSTHLKNYTGADRYIGMEPDLAWLTLAAERLDEAVHVNADTPELTSLKGADVDLIISSELLARVLDPASVLLRLSTVLRPEGLVCLGFEHAGCLTELQSEAAKAGVHQYSVNEVRVMLQQAGFRIDKIYRTYHPQLSRVQAALAQGKRIRLAGISLHELSRTDLEALFCLRLFVIARRDRRLSAKSQNASPKALIRRGSDARSFSYVNLNASLNRTVSPMDRLYSVYADNSTEEEYFASAYRQIEELDGLLRRYCSTRLEALSSIADYACHYGRLLRMLRAALPEAELCAYDIDSDAVRFCRNHFACLPGVVGWKDNPGNLIPRHQLLTCASLLTHTGIDFFRQVLSVWTQLVVPGGLICFTYLGDRYISRWLKGEMDHYGPVTATMKARKAEEYRQHGHALAGFDTPYSDAQEYGVGFMSEQTVITELARYPQLEYLGTLPGDQSEFNQDLAVVRKRLT